MPSSSSGVADSSHPRESSSNPPYPYVADDGRENVQSQDPRITRGSSHDEPAANLRATDRDGYSRDPFAGHHHTVSAAPPTPERRHRVPSDDLRTLRHR